MVSLSNVPFDPLIMKAHIIRKAENVATSEVGEVLASCPGIKDVTVYGVQVPGCDGRAGMAAIVLKDDITLDTIDWTEILNNLSLHLPTYARPLFFRVKKILETTSTFKHLKGDLVKEVSRISILLTLRIS